MSRCESRCDAGTLITAPDCFHHKIECVERCDDCERWPTDEHAAAHLAPRVPSQPTFCRWRHVHYVVRAYVAPTAPVA